MREVVERLALPLLVVLVGGALFVVLVRGTAGTAAALLAAAAVLFAVALVLVTRPSPPVRGQSAATSGRGSRLGWAIVPLPGLLVVYLSFNSGGFSPGPKGLVAFLLALALAARFACAGSPFAGFTRTGLIASVALLALALWALASGLWSNAWGRALVEADQVLVYALTVALITSFPRSTRRLRWMVRGVALAAVAVSLCGLITRLLPDVWAIAPDLAPGRLSFPLTYWNALGLLATLGGLLCLGITSSTREPPAVAIVAATGVPIAATTVLLTFSRGAIAAGAIGVVALVLIGRSRGLLGGLLATVPASAVAIATAYDANLLAKADATTAAAVAQGHHLAWVLAACVAGAGLLRSVLIPLDRRLTRVHLPARLRRPVVVGAWASAAVFCLGALVAASGPLGRQYDRFVQADKLKPTADLRGRLTDPSNSQRIDLWRVGRSAFVANKLKGHGAGTYQVLWSRHRPDSSTVVDAHSLYVETAAELGVAGLALLLAAVGAIFFGVARRARGANRSVYATIFAAGLAWAASAGVDWDWEMAAVTLPFFALGAAALSRSHRRSVRERPQLAWRAATAAAALAIGVLPLLLTLSQHHLEESRGSTIAHKCIPGIKSARRSLSAVGERPEPYQVIAYCELSRGRERPAVAAIRAAVTRDPAFWRYRYDEALIGAAAGHDPRPAARAAAARAPREPQVRQLIRVLATASPSQWRRRAIRTLRIEGDLP